jgi:hypothetical protein
MVRVDVWTVETLDDRELHAEWREPIENLGPMLDRALAQVREWSR